MNDLVWVKRDYTTSVCDRKLGVKWIGPYKVVKVIRGRGVYVLENTFDGTRVQRAADKVRPYISLEEVLVQQREIFVLREECESEEEQEEARERPRREHRPVRRYIVEEDSPQLHRSRESSSSVAGEETTTPGARGSEPVAVEESSEKEVDEEEREDRSRRRRRLAMRYIEEV